MLFLPFTVFGSKNPENPPGSMDINYNKLDTELSGQIYGNGTTKVKVKIILKEKDKKQLGASSSDLDLKSFIVSNGGKIKHQYKSFDGIAAEIQADEIAILSQNPNIERIEIDREVRAFLTETVPLIQANHTWAQQIGGTNLTGKGITVCVIDTGVDYNHPDLGGGFGTGYKVIGGYDFVNSDNDPLDDNGHGTHVAGIVAANGSLKGVAPEAKIVAIKVLDSNGSGLSSNMDAGIDWCTTNSDTYNISIISLSLGGSTYSDYCDSTETSTRNAINAAVAQNISVIIATGNDATYTGVSAPGCISSAIRVGATYDLNVGSISWSSCTDSTTAVDKITCFTNRGANFADMLLAPGALINSTWLNTKSPFKRYSQSGGTSMATPAVSGVAALVMQGYKLINGSIPTPDYVTGRLNSTGEPILDSQTGLTYYRVNALNATLIVDYTPLYILDDATNSPQNRSYNNGSLDFNITVSKAIYNAFYSIDGADNQTMANDTSIHYFNTSNPAQNESFHNVTFWINDTQGNMNRSTVYYQIDLTNPLIGYSSPTPTPNTNTSYSNITVNITYTELYPDSLIFNWNETNETLVCTGNSCIVSKSNLTDGTYSYYSFINDTAGNANITDIRYYTVDTQYPRIINVEPGNNSKNRGVISLNVTAFDSTTGTSSVIANLSNSTTYVNYNLVNSDNIWNVSLNTSQWEDGSYNLSVYAWDFVGKMNSSGYTILIDNTPPVVTIASPLNTTYSNTSVPLTFSVSENTSWTGYSLNGAANVSSGNTTLTAISGANNITVYANDTFNNWGSSTVYFNADNSPPSISGLTLSRHVRVNSTTSNTTLLTWNVSDPSGVHTQWVTANYSNGTLYNTTFTTSPFTLEIADYGTYNITVYANDTYGYLSRNSILLYAEYYVSPVNVTINASNSSYVVNESNVKIRVTANDSSNATVGLEVRVSATNETIQIPAIGNTTSSDSSITLGKRYVKITNISQNENVTRYRIEIPYSSEDSTGYNLYFMYWNGTKWVKLSDYKNSIVPDNNGSLYVFSTGDTGPSLYAEVNHTSVYGMGASVVSAPVVTTASGGGGGGGGVGNTPNTATTYVSRTHTSVPQKIIFDPLKVKNIYEMSLLTIRDVFSFTITVKDLSQRPFDASEFEGTNYNYYRITQSNLPERDIENVNISFKIETQWLINNDLHDDSIVMGRFVDGQWEELPTYYIEQKTIYNYYTAVSPGFSYFVISGKEKEDEIQMDSGITIPLISSGQPMIKSLEEGQKLDSPSDQPEEQPPETQIIEPVVDVPAESVFDNINVQILVGIFIFISLALGIYIKKR